MTRPPEWAAFFSQSAYRYFMQCVAAELDSRGLAYEPCDGGVVLRDPAVTVGLVNLAQQCRRTVPPRWPELVKFLFDQVLAAATEHDVVETLARDPAAATKLLRVRLHPDEYLRELRTDELVIARVASGISLCVAWDLPTSVRLLLRAEVAGWGLPDAALIERGLENVRSSEPVERCVLATDGGVVAYELSGPSHYAASHCLLLEPHLDGATSAVVWVPNRHTVVFAPAASAESAARATRALAPIVERAFQRGPGSLSPKPFWWADGRLGALP